MTKKGRDQSPRTADRASRQDTFSLKKSVEAGLLVSKTDGMRVVREKTPVNPLGRRPQNHAVDFDKVYRGQEKNKGDPGQSFRCRSTRINFETFVRGLI